MKTLPLCMLFLHLHYTTHYTYFSSALALIPPIPFLFSQCFFFCYLQYFCIFFSILCLFIFILSVVSFVVFLFPHNFPIQCDVWGNGKMAKRNDVAACWRKRQRSSMEKTRQVHFYEVRRKKERILNWLSSLQGPVCSAYTCILCFIKSYLNDAFLKYTFCRCYVSSPDFLSPRNPRETAKMEVDIFL